MAERPGDASGDDAEVFAGVYPGLRRFAAVVGAPSVDPDDLVQEAVARALVQGPLAELDDPAAYLRTAIVRLAANRRRSEGRRLQAFTTVAAGLARSSADAYPSDMDELRGLAPADRAIVYLAVVEQRAHGDIAAILGIREPAARKRLSRAMSRLRAAALEEERHG